MGKKRKKKVEVNFSKCILSIDEDERRTKEMKSRCREQRVANNIVGKLFHLEFPRASTPSNYTKAPLCFRDQSPPRYCRDDTIPPGIELPCLWISGRDKDKGYEKLFGQR